MSVVMMFVPARCAASLLFYPSRLPTGMDANKSVCLGEWKEWEDSSWTANSTLHYDDYGGRQACDYCRRQAGLVYFYCLNCSAATTLFVLAITASSEIDYGQ